MSVLMVPGNDAQPWPSLGAEVCALMEAELVFGPGDLRGRAYRLDDEDRALVYRLYEVHPPDHAGDCRFDPLSSRCTVGRGTCGRRRFDAAVVMTRKGTKKSERAAAIAAMELHPEAPVRCDGFRKVDGVWVPVGRPVTDPYIPIVAYTESQAEETAWSSLYVMISEGSGAHHFDIGLERIQRARGDGKAEAVSTSPDSRDGARTTFQVKEETHRWVLPRQLEAHRTMEANLAKRPMAEPWELHVTTGYTPLAGSLAETMHGAALATSELGEESQARSRLFFFYRWADESIDISTPEGLREAIVDASGASAMAFSDIERIASLFEKPDAEDLSYLERVWLNRLKRDRRQAFDTVRYGELVRKDFELGDEIVVLSWHGNRYSDAAGLVATTIETGYQWVVACWEKAPDAGADWEVPEDEVDAEVVNAFQSMNVWRFWVHPEHWESSAARWQALFGEEVVRSFKTNAWTEMTRAVRAYLTAIASGELSHSGDERLLRHIGAAHRRNHVSLKDDDGRALWWLTKEFEHAQAPINLAQAAVIGWAARLQALRDGAAETVSWSAA